MPSTPWQLNVVAELVIGVTDVMLSVKVGGGVDESGGVVVVFLQAKSKQEVV